MDVPSRILVVRSGAIGDVVNALVFATAVKAAAPAVHLGWVVHSLSEPLVRDHPSVDRVHVWRRGAGIGGFWKLVQEARAERYDLAVDLQRIAKSALLARFSGAPRVLGFDRARTKEASWLWTNERLVPRPEPAHMVEWYLDFARHLGIEDPRPRHVFPRDDAAEAFADALVRELGERPILVNLGATKPANRWPPERFGELASRLAQEFELPVCLTGGDADRDAERIAIETAGRAPHVKSLIGKTSLRELAALCARARLVVACDTGPMHIAAACGAPVIALFGPADPRRTGPWDAKGEKGHAIVRVSSRMEDITVEHVLEAARAKLRASASIA